MHPKDNSGRNMDDFQFASYLELFACHGARSRGVGFSVGLGGLGRVYSGVTQVLEQTRPASGWVHVSPGLNDLLSEVER